MTQINLDQLLTMLKSMGVEKKDIEAALANFSEPSPNTSSNESTGEFILNKSKLNKKNKLISKENKFESFIQDLDKNISSAEKQELDMAKKFDQENVSIINSRRRPFSKISAVCRCCNKKEDVNPSLCTKDENGSIRYKCNGCSTRVCE
jgi:hypothetical protein